MTDRRRNRETDKENLTFAIYNAMRLHHSPDASPYPGFKLMCLVYIMFFRKSNKLH